MNVMIDLETMGQDFNTAVVQIGGAYFDPYADPPLIGETFKVNVSLIDELKLFDVSADTIYWWLQQSALARKSICGGLLRSSVGAFNEFNAFMRKAKYVWSHETFDFVIVMNHMQKLKIKPTFHWRNSRDISTLVHLAQGKKYFSEREGVEHDALDDCIYQIGYVSACLKKLAVV